MQCNPETVDVLIVGSGGGGLVAALHAKAAGLEPLVIEKAAVLGGTSTLSHGALWLPNNPIGREAGHEDSVEAAVEYLQHLVGDQGPATTRARQEAYVRGTDPLIRFLRAEGVEFRLINDYPDYYPDAPGARTEGRMLACPLIDARSLGGFQDVIRQRPPLPGGVVISSVEQFLALLSVGYSWRSRAAVARIAATSWRMKLRGVRPLVMGQAYIGHLLRAAHRRQIRILTQTALIEFVCDGGRVVGVRARRGEKEVVIRSRYGVLCNAGGFARNLTLRAANGPQPASTEWTAVIEGDTGDALRAATAIGAATSNLDKAYWLPGLMDHRGVSTVFIAERCLPHSILVDHAGERFANEAESYMELGNEQYEHHHRTPSIPAFLIIDAQHRRRYPLGQALPGQPVRAWLRSGHLKKADTLSELATRCGIDPTGLERTVAHFNEMARAGIDADFGRGASAYDRVYGDPTHTPNPTLGPIEEPPFYAAKMFPTDVGTAGGLVTDAHANVVTADGEPISGLYACGTTAASCAGDVYPGGGISLGQSSVFGLIAADAMIAAARAGAPTTVPAR
jgi:3-oxosteroid 1-dehydrogenase